METFLTLLLFSRFWVPERAKQGQNNPKLFKHGIFWPITLDAFCLCLKLILILYIGGPLNFRLISVSDFCCVFVRYYLLVKLCSRQGWICIKEQTVKARSAFRILFLYQYLFPAPFGIHPIDFLKRYLIYDMVHDMSPFLLNKLVRK